MLLSNNDRDKLKVCKGACGKCAEVCAIRKKIRRLRKEGQFKKIGEGNV